MLGNFSFQKIKEAVSRKLSRKISALPQTAEADFAAQKNFDKKLVYSLSGKKIPSLKQLKHLPKILDQKEKLLAGGLAILILISLIFLGATFYLRNFLPTPKIGGDYTGGLIGAPQYINPLLAQTNDVDSDLTRLIFSGLLKFDADLQPVLDLAEKLDIAEDQKTYTLTLKNDVKWHDGEPLTIDDVIFTFQSIKDPDFKSPLLISFRGVEVQKMDEQTVKFILPQAYPAFKEVLTVGILPEHLWGEIRAINANLTEYNLKPVGSGPWEFKTLAKDRLGNIKSYTLAPNPDYYGAKPFIQKLIFKFYPDFETAVAALKNHSVEGISFLPKELKSQLASQKNLNFYSFNLPQYTAIFFNQKQNEILKEKNIRTALAKAIDKNQILKEALQLEGAIIDGPILPVTLDAENQSKVNFNAEEASKLLDEAGWQKISADDYGQFLKEQKEKQATSTVSLENQNQSTATPQIEGEDEEAKTSQEIFRKKSDKILEITLTTVNQPEYTKAAELIKKFWEDIGLKVNLQIVEGGKIKREIIKPRNYQALLFGINVGSDSDPYPFWHSSQADDPGLNLAQLANREADKLMEEAKKTDDEQKKIEFYQNFYNLLSTELPAIFLYNPTYTYVADKKIKGITADRIVTPADRFNSLSDWYIKTKRIWHGGQN